MARPAVRVAIGGIAMGVAVMLVTLGVVYGFKETVREKVIGFGGHIQVVNFDNNSTYEMQPIVVNDSLLERLTSIDGVVSATPFCTKPGIIKTEEAFQGVVVKGKPLPGPPLKGREEKTPSGSPCLGGEEDPLQNPRKRAATIKAHRAFMSLKGGENGAEDAFFAGNMVRGRMGEDSREVVVSERLCKKLGLDVDSAFYCYFVEEEIRVRKFVISGVYDTEFADYDDLFVIGDISVIRQLNGWDEDQASGVEVRIRDFDELARIADDVYFATANRVDREGNAYYTVTIEEQNPTIFAWLRLLDMNVVVIIILMLAVSAMNIISGLIILILGSIQMIGLLKSLGANNRFIRRIFLTEAAFLVAKGMVWGNVIGLGLCALQYFLRVVPLDPASYYVSYVPIAWTWGAWLVLNIGTLALIMLILLLPASIVSRISPARVMRYE